MVQFSASLHCGFDNPTDAVRENGTYGGQGTAAWRGGLAALLSEQALNTRSEKSLAISVIAITEPLLPW
jgi:hypothetical protein